MRRAPQSPPIMITLPHAAALVAAVLPVSTAAHGLREPVLLPMPIGFYYAGAAMAVALSFVIVAIVWTRRSRSTAYRRYTISSTAWIAGLANNAPLLWSIRIGVLLLSIAAVIAGFVGQQIAVLNILPVLVWVAFAVGMTFCAALVFNFWPLLNPVATAYELFERVSRRSGLHRELPEWVGIWPAVGLFLAYRWIENAYPHADSPAQLAAIIMVFALASWTAMRCFGRERWLARGDPFENFFGILSRFAIFEVSRAGGRAVISIRAPGAGLLDRETLGLSHVALVMLMLSSIAFDAIRGSAPWRAVTASGDAAHGQLVVENTLGLIAFWLVFSAAFVACIAAMRFIARSRRRVAAIAGRFALSLLPIAIAYEFAHYASVLIVDGQRLIYLASDPLGHGYGLGWNLFGTADYVVNYDLVRPERLWYAQLALIVAGHVYAVYLAHVTAHDLFADESTVRVTWIELPMVALMILYTIFSLWTLALPLAAT